ncbi:DUF3343 domain-containing protein [Caldicoprobacter faecalis]|uniref:Putative Se/S carrier protein-like domain-containing protein n=1 Tax=Caldicoprobacter faecalis TaxID=937334 RepID=A0A1I5XIK7_9FIRM|nr:DUF3343 domain-containing protein [Caldicoprobacter faecalis]PZN10102.1 MAG: DUF3343 domain-containing protein [Caldicoprobacter oshimai]SFQ31815.1 Protein of unknown function [Caldicoprobacter faecalis]
MSYMEEYGLIAFSSRQHAIHFSDILKLAGCPVQLVSTPREISLGCGLSIKFPITLTSKVMKVYERYKHPITGFYHIRRIGNRTQIMRIPC